MKNKVEYIITPKGLENLIPNYSFLPELPNFVVEKTNNPNILNIVFEEAPSASFYGAIHKSINECNKKINNIIIDNMIADNCSWWSINGNSYECYSDEEFLRVGYWETGRYDFCTYIFTIEKGSKSATYKRDMIDLDEFT